jgi:DNA-binding NtrC family response regulator
VRELRNLVESMVVLAHGREVGVADIPAPMRREAYGGDRLLPVHIGPILREGERAEGRELEFIVRSLLELKLQVEDLRRRVDDEHARLAALATIASGGAAATAYALGSGAPVADGALGVEPPGVPGSLNQVTIRPGMTMAEIERLAIEQALRESRGNRRKAAENLAIGERTLYRKLKEYNLPLGSPGQDN